MSEALRQAAERVADELERRSRDLRLTRSAEMTPEESDEHLAVALTRMAASLRVVLKQEREDNPDRPATLQQPDGRS
jgi:hypothetical protein